jgi:hypothetical protein
MPYLQSALLQMRHILSTVAPCFAPAAACLSSLCIGPTTVQARDSGSVITTASNVRSYVLSHKTQACLSLLQP